MLTSLAFIFTFSYKLTVVYFLWTGFYFGLNQFIQWKNSMPYEEREYNDIYVNSVIEILSNIRLIKTFSTEDKEIKRLKKEREYQPYKREYGLDFFLSHLLSLLNQVNNVVLLYAAGKMTINGEISYGDFTTFLQYTKFLTEDIFSVTYIWTHYKNMFKDWQRFFEIYDYQPKIKCDDGGIKPSSVSGNITFENATFSYPTKPSVNVIKELNMNIEAGKVVAIVGSSGSGKSTISSLVQRLYDPNEGKITLDGVDLKELDVKWLHNQIGVVSQEPALFSGTVEENITYAVDSYTKDDLDYYSKLANVYDFIHDKAQFPEGYKTIVGERGVKISGGQKQRIAIARALMKKSRLLIFDEATSALDAESESEVQIAIDKIIKMGNITTIIIAHRLSTVKNANRIFVMSKGKIVEEGSHIELLKRNGIYKVLVQTQLRDD